MIEGFFFFLITIFFPFSLLFYSLLLMDFTFFHLQFGKLKSTFNLSIRFILKFKKKKSKAYDDINSRYGGMTHFPRKVPVSLILSRWTSLLLSKKKIKKIHKCVHIYFYLGTIDCGNEYLR